MHPLEVVDAARPRHIYIKNLYPYLNITVRWTLIPITLEAINELPTSRQHVYSQN